MSWNVHLVCISIDFLVCLSKSDEDVQTLDDVASCRIPMNCHRTVVGKHLPINYGKYHSTNRYLTESQAIRK